MVHAGARRGLSGQGGSGHHRTAAAPAAERTLDSPATARFTSMHDSRYLPRSNPPRWSVCLLALLLATPSFAHAGAAPGDGHRVRARELGVAPGIFAPGRLHALPALEGVPGGTGTLKGAAH